MSRSSWGSFAGYARRRQPCFEVSFIRDNHGVGLQMFPHQFIGISGEYGGRKNSLSVPASVATKAFVFFA
jgi:hypothetical protein